MEIDVKDFTAYKDFRSILKDQLAMRIEQNKNYSLRAFARDLELSPSRVSEVLSGKQGLSVKAAKKISEKLGFQEEEKNYFCDLVESVHARSPKLRDFAKIRLQKYKKPEAEHLVRIDIFKAISDWYHLALLELVSTKWFKNDTRWIAKKLGISEIEVELAIDRLIRLKFLHKKRDKLYASQEQGHIPGGVPSESIRKFHSQLLQKASEALRMQSLDKREFQSAVLAVDKKDIPEAKKEIDKFRNKFCKNRSEAEEKDGLYCLAIQFFDLEKELL